MAIKDWLNSVTSAASKGGSSPKEDLSIDDLITLERHEEALAQLKIKVKENQRDYRSRTLLADVLLKTGKTSEAIDEYLSVADRYTAEGFHNKGHALIAKLARRLPHDETLQKKMAQIERAKRLERRKQLVADALGATAWAMELRHHWNELIQGPIIEELSRDQLKKLFPLLSIRRLTEGELLVGHGEAREELYIILTGEIAAEVMLPSGTYTDLRAFLGGQIIGEHALLQRQAWPASYRAKTVAKVLSLDRQGLEQSLVGEEDPRGFLDLLRAQGNDHHVLEAASKMKSDES